MKGVRFIAAVPFAVLSLICLWIGIEGRVFTWEFGDRWVARADRLADKAIRLAYNLPKEQP